MSRVDHDLVHRPGLGQDSEPRRRELVGPAVDLGVFKLPPSGAPEAVTERDEFTSDGFFVVLIVGYGDHDAGSVGLNDPDDLLPGQGQRAVCLVVVEQVFHDLGLGIGVDPPPTGQIFDVDVM